MWEERRRSGEVAKQETEMKNVINHEINMKKRSNIHSYCPILIWVSCAICFMFSVTSLIFKFTWIRPIRSGTGFYHLLIAQHNTKWNTLQVYIPVPIANIRKSHFFLFVGQNSQQHWMWPHDMTMDYIVSGPLNVICIRCFEDMLAPFMSV